MKRAKLTIMLSLGILPILSWVLALADTKNALVTAYGIPGAMSQALCVSLISAYIIVRVLEELRD